MRKLLLTLVCVCALTFGAVFSAQAETTGVYVAPKFLMMWQNNDSKMEAARRPTYDWGYEASAFNSQFTLGGALAVGYDFFPQHKLPIRAELEFAMRGSNEFEADSIFAWANPPHSSVGTKYGEATFLTNVTTLMANFFYDFHNDSDFTPYVTAGAGLAFIRAECEWMYEMGGYRAKWVDESETFTNFAWNVGAGVAWKFNENVAVDLGYRYVNMGNVSMSGSSKIYPTETLSYDIDATLANHEVALGIRYTF